MVRFHAFLNRSVRHFARDDGVAGIVIAMVVAIVAFSALSVFFSRYGGPARELLQNQETRSNFKLSAGALAVGVITNADTRLPCPASGADGDGVSEATCDSGTNISGVLPWTTLGIGADEATDSFGTVLSYVITPGNLQVCDTMGGVPTGDVSQGNLRVSPDDTTALYAVVSHGRNRRGGFSRDGATLPAATTDNELANCPTGGSCTDPDPATVTTGPFSTIEGDDYFDDIVHVGTSAEFESLCESLQEELPYNTTYMEDSFDTPGAYSTDSNDDLSANAAGATATNGRLQMTGDVYLRTGGDLGGLLRTEATPLYIAVEWTPSIDDNDGNAFFSIVTRTDADNAGRSAIGAEDIIDSFDQGITVRFGGQMDANDGDDDFNIRIFAGDGATFDVTTASSGMDVAEDDTYLLEVFDDGERVWARATEINSEGQTVLSGGNANTVTFQHETSVDAAASESRVAFVNGASPAQSLIDNLIVAKGMWALEVGSGGTPSAGYVAQTSYTAPDFDESIVEFWIRPLDNPPYDNAENADTDTDYENVSGPSANIPRFSFQGSEPGTIRYTTAEGTNPLSAATLGFNVRQWVHVAAVCQDNTTTRLFLNGTERVTRAQACDSSTSPTQLFLGALNATDTDHYFHGQIAEFRIWSTDRSTEVDLDDFILDNMFVRYEDNADLHTRWGLDDGYVGASPATTAADTAGAQAGTLNGSATFVGARSPMVSSSSDVCPGNESATEANTCIYTADATINIPLDINEITVKMWGGGGGGDDNSASPSNGGGGGYATATISSFAGTDIRAQSLTVYVGAGGVQGDNPTGTRRRGGTGGGGSALLAGNTVLLVAGGGGGAAGSGGHGGAGGGASGGNGQGYCPGNGASGSAGGGAASCTIGSLETGTGTAGENFQSGMAASGDGGDITHGSNPALLGGVGFGDGGDSRLVGSTNNQTHGAGGGGGYGGGGAGGLSTSTMGPVQFLRSGGGGGGSGYFIVDAGVTSASTTTGSGATPGNNGDADRDTAGEGGIGGSAGTAGRVVIRW